MFRKASKDIRRIKVDDGFDADHAVARAVRALVPPEARMRPESRVRLKERLLSMREDAALGVAETSRKSAGRLGRRRAYAFAAAGAAVCLVAAAVVPVLLSFSRREEAPPRVKHYARMNVPRGIVEVLQGGGEWRKAQPGEMLAPGSRIRTEKRSLASITFPDGSAMRVTDGSEVRIKDVGAMSVTIEHLSGGTYHRAHDGTDYEVLNSDVSTRSAGAVFNVENRVPGNLEIVTIDKAVAVEIGANKPITVNRGEVMVVAMAGEKKADKQPVSRERLEEDRLYASASQDAKAGYSTGIYEQLDVPMDRPPEKPAPQPATTLSIELKGAGMETGTSLTWGVSGDAAFEALVLLRSDESEPVFPTGEIARYADTSINSATDNSVLQEQTYQYRMAAVKGDAVFAYSNTLVVTIPKAAPKPARASVDLVTKAESGKVLLEWSVAGATGFSGFALERVMVGAPPGAKTPDGSWKTVRIESKDVMYSYTDASVESGYTYSYRVGLVVDGSVMVYSNSGAVEIPAE